MDEFELFRARAYGCDLGAPAEVMSGRCEDGSLLTAVRSNSKRRHSSVGVCLSVTPMAGNCDGGVPEDRRCQRSSEDRWTNKPRLTAQVTVAIEPPSPTDNRMDGYDNRQQQQRSRAHRRNQNEALGDEDDDDDDGDDGDDVEWRRKNVHRTKTASALTRTLSPRKQRAADIRRHQEKEEDEEEEEEFRVNGLNYCTSDPDEETALLQHQQQLFSSDEDHRQRSSCSSVKRTRRTPSPSLERPECLRLTPSATEANTAGARRRRGSAVDSLLLVQPRPPSSTSRRNSCVGTLSPKPSTTSSPPATYSPGGRRGSAITYLSDVPVEGSAWRLSTPAGGSPLRRGSCFEDRRGSGGLGVDDFKAHLEELTLAAAEAAGESVGAAGSKRPAVSSDSEASAGDSTGEGPEVCRVMVVGGPGVGKTTLTNQLMTSEYLANSENDQDVCSQEHSVCVCLDGQITKVHIVQSTADEAVDESSFGAFDAYLVVYSVTDSASFAFAQSFVQSLISRRRRTPTAADPPSPHPSPSSPSPSSPPSPHPLSSTVVVLVANKQDLVRNRIVSSKEGKRLGLKRRCRYLEVSALLDHKVDEVLVTIIRECRSHRRRMKKKKTTTDDDEEEEDSGNDEDEDDEDEEGEGCLRRILDVCRKICK